MKLTLRQLLFPLIWPVYHLASKAQRGGLLVPFHYLNPTEDSLEIHFGRIPGWRYGSFCVETKIPRLTMSRKDRVSWEVDFLKDSTSVLEITKTDLVVHRDGQPPFVLCQCKRPYLFQLAAIWSRMPVDIKPRLRFPTAESFAS